MKFSVYLQSVTSYPVSRRLSCTLDNLEEQGKLWDAIQNNNLRAMKMHFVAWKGN